MGLVHSFQCTAIGLLLSLVFPLSVRGAVLTSPSSMGGFEWPGDESGIDGKLSQIIVHRYENIPSTAGLQVKRDSFLDLLALQLEDNKIQEAAITIQKIGEICVCLKEFDRSLYFYEKALKIHQNLDDIENQIEVINYIVRSHYLLGEYIIAEDILRAEIEKIRDLDSSGLMLIRFKNPENARIDCCPYVDWMSECDDPLTSDLDNFDELDSSNPNITWETFVGKYRLLSTYYQEARGFQSFHILTDLGWAYQNSGNYYHAIEAYKNALEIIRKEKNDPQIYPERLTIGRFDGEIWILIEMSIVYSRLGDYSNSLNILNLALKLNRKAEADIELNSMIFNRIGEIYLKQEKYEEALVFFNKALDAEYSPEYMYLLNNIGLVHAALGDYSEAIYYHRKALFKNPDYPDDRGATGVINNALGFAYAQIGKYTQAFKTYQDALSLFTKIRDKPGQRLTLVNMASLLETQGEIELAILFYKQAVNITESIRGNLGLLTLEQQKSYLATVESDYRHLADLLLQQNRVLEAQRVLDLLKVQELDDYLRGVRGNDRTTRGIDNLPPEQKIWDSYTSKLNQAVELGKELNELRQIPETDRTETQQQRIAELVDAEQQTLGEFNQFIESEEVVILLEQLTYNVRRQSPDLAELNALRDNLRNLEKNAVLLYPLILEDRLELVLVTPFAPPVRVPVTVTQAELNRAIVEFRTALQNPYKNATQPAQKLYSWLIEPLESALAEANAETIIYAPDGQLRYIPLAALHDGNRWLVERFRINHITAASLTDLNTQPQSQPNILAGAFANGFHTVEAGDREFNFDGLPFAGVEVENLAATVPNTTSLVDDAFNPDATIPRMNDYNIVHLATHAAFVTGRPEDSFILFGDGSHVTLDTVKDWSLQNVDLVVLSACETGLGGDLGNGKEILGFGYLMQQAGARAAIASLWSVDDGGTQALMNAFYSALQTGFSKAEALRQAQIALITDDYTALGDRRGAAIEVRWITEDVPPEVRNRLEHPFYWAPFILIGNGL